MYTLDTTTVIVNLLKEDKKTYLSIERLQNLLIYIRNELSKRDKLHKYQIYFNVNFNSIERTVLYNNNIFKLDLDGEIIFLRESETADILANQYQISNEVKAIITNFIVATAA